MLIPTLVTSLLALGVSAEPHRRSLANKAHARRALASRNEERTLVKRFSGQATFYDTSVGVLACGGHGSNDAYIVALNSAQYGSGYPGPQCFKTLTISANGVTIGGVQVVDECPTCAYGDLDLSPGLFRRFATEDQGIFQLSWEWDDGKEPEPTTTSTWTPEPTPSTTSTTSTTSWTSTSTSTTSTSSSSSTITSSASLSLSRNATSTASMNGTLSASASASRNATVPITSDASPKASGAVAAAQTSGLIVVEGDGEVERGVLGDVGQMVARVGYMIVSAALGERA